MENGWLDPHNGGTYSIIEQGAKSLKGRRVTGDGKYTDLYDFTFEANPSGCFVTSCSESQVTSVLDFSTNFCNLHNLMDGGYEFEEEWAPHSWSCMQHDDSKCGASSKNNFLRGEKKKL